MDTEATRLKKIIALLDESAPSRLAIITDTAAEPGKVILTIAIRHLAAFEMTAPAEKYDGLRLLEILEEGQNGDDLYILSNNLTS
jgi:hypothetical protein